uniref:Uncharacterized protein n=1 Tax=Anguilla anguilla TaxID=7936 RepID=A0A0E9R8V9_ANGAN
MYSRVRRRPFFLNR